MVTPVGSMPAPWHSSKASIWQAWPKSIPKRENRLRQKPSKICLIWHRGQLVGSRLNNLANQMFQIVSMMFEILSQRLKQVRVLGGLVERKSSTIPRPKDQLHTRFAAVSAKSG